jgi:hypothetical protein
MINELKREIEIRRSHWRVLFIFNNQQSQLNKEFRQIMMRLRPNEDGFAQFACSVLSEYRLILLYSLLLWDFEGENWTGDRDFLLFYRNEFRVKTSFLLID